MADGPPDPIDTRLVRRLAAILTDTGLSEIEVERDGLKIRVARTLTAAPQVQAYAPAAPALPAPPVADAAAPAATTTTESLPAGDVIKSPMVGTAYLSPQPEAPAFVKVGDRVAVGQTLLIIEAMKTMNPIPSPIAGVVTAIVAEDGEPVEFGQPLMVVKAG